MKYNIKVLQTYVITDQDIDDIMATALEGGINYWCSKVIVVSGYLGEFASEQIARGGSLKLYDAEDDKMHMLTREKLLEGVQKAIERHYFDEYEWFNGTSIDTCNVDADVADVIIQLALFGDIIYG